MADSWRGKYMLRQILHSYMGFRPSEFIQIFFHHRDVDMLQGVTVDALRCNKHNHIHCQVRSLIIFTSHRCRKVWCALPSNVNLWRPFHSELNYLSKVPGWLTDEAGASLAAFLKGFPTARVAIGGVKALALAKRQARAMTATDFIVLDGS